MANELEEVIAGMTKKEAAVIDRARELIQASDGRSLYLAPGGRVDVDVNLYAALSRAVVELRTERGELRFVEAAEERPGIIAYQAVVTEWMRARARSRDALPQEQESEWSDKVDAIWARLSVVEREHIELTAHRGNTR